MNIIPNIQRLVGKKLHCQQGHPLCLIKEKIYNFLGSSWEKFDNIDPKVSIEDNFDRLLVPRNHVSRRESDNFYIDDHTMLRNHTSAHQGFLIQQQLNQFLVTGDVYRKGEINPWNYPVKHQIEGVRINDETLHETMTGLIEHLLPETRYRKVQSEFSYADPSYEYEIFDGSWMDALGCGIIRPEIFKSCGRENDRGWSFGINLEKLAMLVFKIPDIRWFWNPKIADRIKNDKFENYILPKKRQRAINFRCSYKFIYSDFCLFMWDMSNGLIEDIKLVERVSNGTIEDRRKYNIVYSDLNRDVTDFEIDDIHDETCSKIEKALDIELIR